MTNLLERIGLEWPIFQAPMAGTSTPAMGAPLSRPMPAAELVRMLARELQAA
ncbi:MAG TPA: hypothetical protein VH189_14145 [Rhizomicrobium sp.]|jgi:NAD(P)H-dependent flavin oxidoreductase YrpB (nitropropane dioxygenase family)|nr:hypothetical protein [Rhizomicrobium sp.]